VTIEERAKAIQEDLDKTMECSIGTLYTLQGKEVEGGIAYLTREEFKAMGYTDEDWRYAAQLKIEKWQEETGQEFNITYANLIAVGYNDEEANKTLSEVEIAINKYNKNKRKFFKRIMRHCLTNI